MTDAPRYLFHWLPLHRLRRFHADGVIKPAWEHYLLDEMRMVRGISTCEEPMLWSPDEGRPREPCLILDRSRIDAPVHPVRSGEAYHLTKKVKAALRVGKDTAPSIETALMMRKTSFGGLDEYFVEGRIAINAVVGLGYEEPEEDGEGFVSEVRRIADRMAVPVLDMTGWEVGCPGIQEVDRILREMPGCVEAFESASRMGR